MDRKKGESAVRPRHRFRWKQWLAGIGIVVLVLLIGAELFARFYLGLGDPPLSIEDSAMEYRFKPSMSYRRFGNRITYNAYSMRSGPVTPHKTLPGELRVIMLGDSIINGGSQTDDSQLASALLQKRLSDATGRPVFVGNCSAGSWGTPNELAYVQKFGWFDADVAVIVISSGDAGDVPDFKKCVGITPDMPDHKPILALQELMTRYLLPRLEDHDPSPRTGYKPPLPPEHDVQWSRDALLDLVKSAHAAGIKTVIIAQHLQIDEQYGKVREGHDLFLATAREAGIEPVQLGQALEDALTVREQPYRDYLHPNALGQKLMADTLFDPILAGLKSATATTQTAR